MKYFEEDDEKEFINDSESEEILFNMSSEDFIENEIMNQLNDEGIFNSYKRDHVEFYLEKYKFMKLKFIDNENSDFLDTLKYNKEEFISNVAEAICDKFNINMETDDMTTKNTKILYTFFVLNYKDNLKELFINVLKKNKQVIIKEIKTRKRHRDIGITASKAKFYNNNDAFIINNLDYILFNIIPSMEFDSDFIDYIIDYDDNINYNNMRKLIDNSKIELDSDTFKSFIEPFMEHCEGYTDVVSEIVIKLTSDAKQNEISIF